MDAYDSARPLADAAVALAAAGAVLFFCFTPRGRRQLHRWERWLQDGEQETARLVTAVGRTAGLIAAMASAVGPAGAPAEDARRERGGPPPARASAARAS
ncbi:MAG: hypothetical protein R2752_17325 [Vicinamibacterales bacterium]